MTLPPATVGTADEELDAILERNLLDTSPPDHAAVSAEYIRSLDLVLIRIDDGSRLVIQRELMQGLEDATPEQLADIRILSGDIIEWTELDVHHYLPRLLEGKYASERWKHARKQQRSLAA